MRQDLWAIIFLLVVNLILLFWVIDLTDLWGSTDWIPPMEQPCDGPFRGMDVASRPLACDKDVWDT